MVMPYEKYTPGPGREMQMAETWGVYVVWTGGTPMLLVQFYCQSTQFKN